MPSTDSKLLSYALESMKPLRSSFHTSKVSFFPEITLKTGLIEKEDDEVLFAIAEELGKVW